MSIFNDTMNIKSKILTFFSSFSKKANEQTEESFHIRSIKELTVDEKAKLKQQFDRLKERLCSESVDNRRKEDARVKKANSKCPHCKSTNVNNRIKRLQGEISGSGSGSFSGAGFLGIGSIGGSYSSNYILV